MTKATTKKVKQSGHDLYQDLIKIKDALADTTEGLKGKAGNLVSELLENFQGRGSDLQDEIVEYVTDKPLKSLGFAVLLGIVVSKVIL
jgi:ElaB/YqjD/DUF883 family membrane-anchored ribosome-binding protein